MRMSKTTKSCLETTQNPLAEADSRLSLSSHRRSQMHEQIFNKTIPPVVMVVELSVVSSSLLLPASLYLPRLIR